MEKTSKTITKTVKHLQLPDKSAIRISKDEFRDILFFAWRYGLTRNTVAPNMVQKWLMQYSQVMFPHDFEQMADEIKIAMNLCAHPANIKAEWEIFRAWCIDEFNKRKGNKK